MEVSQTAWIVREVYRTPIGDLEPIILFLQSWDVPNVMDMSERSTQLLNYILKLKAEELPKVTAAIRNRLNGGDDDGAGVAATVKPKHPRLSGSAARKIEEYR